MATKILSDTWAAVTLFALDQGPRRHGELVGMIGGISRKVLTQTLRRPQNHGLVERRAYAKAPSRAEYVPTDLGRTLVEPIESPQDRARLNAGAVTDVREGR